MDEESGQETELDAQAAVAIMQAAQKRARRELAVSQPVMLAAWGAIYIIAYGALWLSVRGQRPYSGPTSGVASAVSIFALIALTVTAAVVARASSGVGGRRSEQRRLYYLALSVGIVGAFVLEAALDNGGASRAVIGLIGASGPVLATGIAYMAGSAIDVAWPVFGLGAWLVVTAAGSAFAGPVGVWLADGLSGGLAFLLTAIISWRWAHGERGA